MTRPWHVYASHCVLASDEHVDSIRLDWFPIYVETSREKAQALAKSWRVQTGAAVIVVRVSP